MNWLNRLPNSRRAATGLEWTLWCKLPAIAILGTVVPLLVSVVLHVTADSESDAAQLRWLQMADYFVGGVIIFHWTMVLTVAIGCVIVMVMKGPGYVADGYPLSHADRPRKTPETSAEAARYLDAKNPQEDIGPAD